MIDQSGGGNKMGVGALMSQNVGLFLSERIMRNGIIGGDAYSEFFAQAKAEKNEWKPLKQGLFDGSCMNFMEIYNKAEAFYQGNRR